MKKLFTLVIMLVLMLYVIVNASAASKESEKIESITLNKETVVLWVKKSDTIKANVLPKKVKNKKVTWTSSDDEIAAVSNGKVKAKQAGICTITAEAKENPEVNSSCQVLVLDKLTDRIDCKYIKLYSDKFSDLNTKAKQAKFAILAIRDTLEYCQLVYRDYDIEVLKYFSEEAKKNGEIYINAGSVTINVVLGDKKGHCINLEFLPATKTIMYSVFSNDAKKVLYKPQKIDIVSFRKFDDMSSKEILMDID